MSERKSDRKTERQRECYKDRVSERGRVLKMK